MGEPDPSAAAVPASAAPSYRVLARKYRPTSLDGLVGQEAMVRTLANAFQSGRIAHAYMLAGVRGVGKTTTARIIARALNCVGPDGNGGVTVRPCGVCEHCLAIAEDRHLDVIEMDAASRTGVEAMRELLDGVRYRPTMARYKVYIVDEVHMLSISAFNALLKTLEEPPVHVKFIFATTELRKVPVTVLSRCQRFDLRRVDAERLASHLGEIARLEQVTIEPAALALIARAADGSVRDGLSLLDQAIAYADRPIDETMVRDMLGLADRTITFDLFEAVMAGDPATALQLVERQYAAGADPALIVEDLLDLTHWVTRIKVAPSSVDAPGVPEAERVRGRALAEGLVMGEVTRAWQILLKGLSEVRIAPAPREALEMVLIRLAFAADLPTPEEALTILAPATRRGRSAASPGMPAASPPSTASPGSRPNPGARIASGAAPTPPPVTAPTARALPRTADVLPEAGEEREAVPDSAMPGSFEAVVELIAECREAILHSHLVSDVRLVRFEPGKIELRLEDQAPRDLPQRLSRLLGERTGRPWLVTISQEPGSTPLSELRKAEETAMVAMAEADPLVQAILARFPGARIASVRRIAATEPAASEPAAGETGADAADPPLDEGELTTEDNLLS